MSETATSPEAGDVTDVASKGVADQGTSAPNDDIDTEAFDRAPAPDDDDPETPEGETGDVTDPDKPANAETFEIETEDGEKVKVPAKLKDAFLRQAAFTQKTQELAAERRQVAETAQALAAEKAQQAEAFEAFRADHVKVGQLESGIAAANSELDAPLDARGLTLRTINWAAFRQQAQGNEEMADLYRDYRARYDGLRENLADLDTELGAAKTTLTAKEAKRLEDAATSANADLAKRREETKTALEAAVPGWNKDKATAVVMLMHQGYGVSEGEIAEATDPRLWRMAHDLVEARAKIASLSKSRTAEKTADNHVKAQTTTPAVTTKGAGTSARDPSTAAGDGLGTESWMVRRNRQVQAKRRA